MSNLRGLLLDSDQHRTLLSTLDSLADIGPTESTGSRLASPERDKKTDKAWPRPVPKPKPKSTLSVGHGQIVDIMLSECFEACSGISSLLEPFNGSDSVQEDLSDLKIFQKSLGQITEMQAQLVNDLKVFRKSLQDLKDASTAAIAKRKEGDQDLIKKRDDEVGSGSSQRVSRGLQKAGSVGREKHLKKREDMSLKKDDIEQIKLQTVVLPSKPELTINFSKTALWDSYFRIFETIKGGSQFQSHHRIAIKPIKGIVAKHFWKQHFQDRGLAVVSFEHLISSLAPEGSHDRAHLARSLCRVFNPYRSFYVRPSAFDALVTLCGPIHEISIKARELCGLPFFYGFISSTNSNHLLKNAPPGSFLLRMENEKRATLIVDRSNDAGQISSHRVFVHEEQFFMSGDPNKYSTLLDLVNNLSAVRGWKPYVDNLLRYFPSFYADMSVEEAEEKLAQNPYMIGTFIISFSMKPDTPFLHIVYIDDFPEVDSVRDQDPLIGQKPPIKVISLDICDQGYFEPVDPPKSIVYYTSIQEFINKHPHLSIPYAVDGIPIVTFSQFLVDPEPFEELWGPQKLNEGIELKSKKLGYVATSQGAYPEGSQGAIILCDAFRATLVGNRAVSVICDGCGWGARPREAANAAAKEFVNIFKNIDLQYSIIDPTSLRKQLSLAVNTCHEAIKFGKETPYEAGTTTILGGVLAKIEGRQDDYLFMFVGVGDCKVLRYSPRTGACLDFTETNREDITDPSDCGGRIGPIRGPKGDPDLRNLRISSVPCKEDDLIILITDGIYDNLDPAHMGDLPSQHGLEGNDWHAVDGAAAAKVKQNYLMKLLTQYIHSANGKPKVIARALVSHTQAVTKKTRSYMEANPNQAEPSDYHEYPGKMDHCTCTILKVQNLDIGLAGVEQPQRKIEKIPSILSTPGGKLAKSTKSKKDPLKQKTKKLPDNYKNLQNEQLQEFKDFLKADNDRIWSCEQELSKILEGFKGLKNQKDSNNRGSAEAVECYAQAEQFLNTYLLGNNPILPLAKDKDFLNRIQKAKGDPSQGKLLKQVHLELCKYIGSRYEKFRKNSTAKGAT